ncbi:tetratricopeptide repeat protein [Ulvibacter antarcticus]|uniref:Tetratricopeptide repeat protein n=1 Tax=Ulvibacter antarcticus TaxID=442714 RepID=A0A3L9YW25_9FLAO|nr:hypothetical protein [Ulvibacter antarcticus]RMA64713.1 hypothetical protein BXY75_1593 [Ulvibacter antarcticus]
MKKIVIILIAIISFQGISQSSETKTKYQQGMLKAFDLWQNNQSLEAANMFERIAIAEPDNWLPPFYIAQINVFNSFSEKDKTTVTAQLGKARDFLNDAMALSKDNPEIMVLEAQWYTAWVVFDGMQYGMKYSPKIAELYQKAMQLAPENPRVVLGNTEWQMGSAQFFGQPVDKYCPEIERAIALFDTFEPEGEFYPRGGKDYAESVLAKTCK